MAVASSVAQPTNASHDDDDDDAAAACSASPTTATLFHPPSHDVASRIPGPTTSATTPNIAASMADSGCSNHQATTYTALAQDDRTCNPEANPPRRIPDRTESSITTASQPTNLGTQTTDTAVRISLLLTTGARHPFTINKRLLQRRNVTAPDDDAWNVTIYQMKSLIWHEWLSEWSSRPTTPDYIRLIFLGALLDDEQYLKDCRFSRTEVNVLHMTIRPQDLLDDDDVKWKEGKDSQSNQRSQGNCCIIL